jgi:hypothetical protein
MDFGAWSTIFTFPIPRIWRFFILVLKGKDAFLQFTIIPVAFIMWGLSLVSRRGFSL